MVEQCARKMLVQYLELDKNRMSSAFLGPSNKFRGRNRPECYAADVASRSHGVHFEGRHQCFKSAELCDAKAIMQRERCHSS